MDRRKDKPVFVDLRRPNEPVQFMLNEEENELLVLLAEECAEVIQAVTKIQRFDLGGSGSDGVSNIDRLQAEIGDVMAAAVLLSRARLVSLRKVEGAKRRKLAKVIDHLRFKCQHEETVPGPRIVREEVDRFTEVCAECGKWRIVYPFTTGRGTWRDPPVGG